MANDGNRAPLLWLVLPLMAGLAAGCFAGGIPAGALLAAALPLAALALILSERSPGFWGASLAAAMALVGVASGQKRPPPAALARPAEVRLSLRIERVSPPRSGARAFSGIGRILACDPPLRGLVGERVYGSIALAGNPPPLRSSIVALSARIAAMPARPASGSLYAGLKAQGIAFRLNRARLLAPPRPPGLYRRSCERLAERMNALLGRGLERRPDLAGVYRAMMLGRKRELRPGQRRLFRWSGTMHLFAINGLHIGVVALTLRAILGLARCPAFPAGALVLALLWIDVDATGASPSAVRAFLMLAAFQFGSSLRRPSSSLSALAVSALIVLLLRPLDFFGASFQMSYGVMTGILGLGLPLAARLQERFPPLPGLPPIAWNRRQRVRAALQRHLLAASGVGAAAALVGAVTGVQFFRLISPLGFAANLALVPLASLVIAAGVASLGFGLAGAMAISRGFNLAAGVLLALIQALLHLGVRLPGAFFTAHYRAAWIGPTALVLLLASCLAGLGFGWKRERGGFWPPLAIVALALLFGVKFGR